MTTKKDKEKLQELLLGDLKIIKIDDNWVEVSFDATTKKEFNVDTDVPVEKLARKINNYYLDWKRLNKEELQRQTKTYPSI